MLIYVRPFSNIDDGAWPVSLDVGAQPVWSPDGTALFYRAGSAFGNSLMVAQVETRAHVQPQDA